MRFTITKAQLGKFEDFAVDYFGLGSNPEKNEINAYGFPMLPRNHLKLSIFFHSAADDKTRAEFLIDVIHENAESLQNKIDKLPGELTAALSEVLLSIIDKSENDHSEETEPSDLVKIYFCLKDFEKFHESVTWLDSKGWIDHKSQPDNSVNPDNALTETAG